jgi:uncharacterized protein YfaS (alpha-2-macroglobulin family)
MRHLRFSLLLVMSAAALCQSESEPYFSLTSQRTFPSNSKPFVAMSAWNVAQLDFRVYRINDPVKFFEQLEDPHQFGGHNPAPPHAPTMLERIHSWKSTLRAGIRRSFRAQFTEPPSNHIESLSSHPVAAPASKGVHYAEAPVLNPDQLVHSFTEVVKSQSRWDRQNVAIPVTEKGVYLVEAVNKVQRAYTILVISDIAMVTKTGKGRVVNLVLDRKTGEPLPGVDVYPVGRDKTGSKTETNQDGIAELAFAGGENADLRVVARSQKDVAVTILQNYAFGVDREEWQGYIYTDRPVYRPGHTVHFKGILRVTTPAGYSVPAGKQISVQIQDTDQKSVYQKTLTVSQAGSISGDLDLPASASLGNYSIQAKAAGDSFMSGDFEVQEYKKPEYEVRVTPARPRVLQGETIQATIDSRYYFGEPVNGAKVQWAVYRDQYYFPLWYDPNEETVANDRDDEQNGDEIKQEDGVLDADGKLAISFPAEVSDHHHDFIYRVEARVTDAGNREIVGKGWIVSTYGSFVVNVESDRYFYNPGARANLTVQARDYDSKPVATKVHVELLRYSYRDPDKHEVISSSDSQTGADGNNTIAIQLPTRGGSYRVHLTAHTPEGRDVDDFTYFYVEGGALSDFGPNENRTVQIIADKKTYRAGDTIHLMIVAGKANTPVYVTVEGRDLRQYKLIRSKDTTAEFDFPVTVNDEPNITVAAAYIRNGQFYSGQKQLRVPPVEHTLNVKLATDKAQYQPGQSAEYSLDVTNAEGKPVHAEFSLGVVDEAIYGIRKDMTPDPVYFFFANSWDRVATEDSLEFYFNGESGKRKMRLADIRPGSRLAQLKPDRLVQPKIRKAFPDTAFWAADIATDSNGHARAKIDFPDSLTTWRATARGASVNTEVGSATLKTIVRKNLMVRLVAPRFFVQGDEVVISAIVHNYLTNGKKAHVTLDASGLDVVSGGAQDVDVASRGEAKVDWRVRAKQARSASITVKALTNEESDGLQQDIPVTPPGVEMAQARGGSLADGGAASLSFTFPDKTEPGSRAISVRVAPSIAGSLFGALDYLTSFPYGCVEQTMSSFLPNITVRQAVKDLGLKVTIDDADLQTKIRAGIDRLVSFQHEDGGWGWWQTDESHPFMTAYVVAGLSQAQQGGATVSADVVNKGVDWIKQDLGKDTKLAADLRAYMVYALAAAGQTSPVIGDVYNKRASLSPYGQAILGLAMELVKDNRSAEMVAALEKGVEQSGEEAYWKADRDEMLDFSIDASPEATAFATKLISHQKPTSPLLPKAALWLMNHRNEGYWWSSTKQTAMVIYGLTDYLRATHELAGNATATVYVNDKPVLTKKLDQSTALNGAEIVLDESKLNAGANAVRVTAQGEGRVYYSARASYYSGDEKLQKTGNVSLNVLRDYYKLSPTKDGEKIVYDLVSFDGQASVGDVIAVRLTVTGSEWRYLMVEDPIPSGTEFIERDQSYELKSRPPWWQYYFTRREMHDNRMAIFETYFPQGQQQYFYLLKVVNPGSFQVSPARVEPMYQPGVMATTESKRVEVKQ